MKTNHRRNFEDAPHRSAILEDIKIKKRKKSNCLERERDFRQAKSATLRRSRMHASGVSSLSSVSGVSGVSTVSGVPSISSVTIAAKRTLEDFERLRL